MLDDLFQDQTDAVLDDMVSRPPPVRPAAKKSSVWSTLTAVPRAVATAAAETGAAVAEVVKGYGQVSAATDPMIGVMATRDTRDKLVQGQEQARRDMLERGVEVNSQASESLRAAARYWMPDPQTAGVAEQTVFGLVRFGAKAVAAAGAGPAAGPVLLGTDEGLAAAEGLRDQGVDLGTRTQAGVVAGATAGAAVALPVAAPGSLAGTVGLWAVGGPGGFIAQQQATRSILERAGYDDLAASYDPLDPVGLAVSSLIPAGFAAWAMRGARAGRAAPKEPAAAGVEAVAERSPAERAPAEPVAESAPATEQPRATLDEVDAARVEMLQQHVEASGLYRADDARAAAMHLDAFARSLEDLGAGRRVDVTDLVPVERLEVARALDVFAGRLEETRADLIAQAAGRAEPGAVRQMRAELVEAQAQLEALQDPAAVKARAAELQRSSRQSYKQALAQARKEFQAQAGDVQARVSRLESLIEDNASAQQAFDALNLMDRQAEKVRAQREGIDAPTTRETPIAAAVREAATHPAKGATEATRPAAAESVAEKAAAPRSQKAGPPEVADARGPGAAPRDTGGARGGSAGVEAVAQRLADVKAQFPDLTVQMDGMDKPMPLADFLAQVEREAMEGTDDALGGNDASLMQVAAECALMNGA